jgi:hypothetical protein
MAVISQADLTELKRISTNTYDADKACMNRIIRGLGEYDRIVRTLTAANEALTKELKELRASLKKD